MEITRDKQIDRFCSGDIEFVNSFAGKINYRRVNVGPRLPFKPVLKLIAPRQLFATKFFFFRHEKIYFLAISPSTPCQYESFFSLESNYSKTERHITLEICVAKRQ